MNEMPSPHIIGTNVRRLRHNTKQSLDDLARTSGVSKAMLSQIESGKVNPTIATMWKIAQAFQVDFNVLLKGGGEKIRKFTVCRREDLISLDQDSSPGVHISVLSPPSQAGDLELYLMRFGPGAKLESEPHAQGAEEFLTVLSGSVKVEAGGRSTVLRRGDVAIYECDVNHKIENNSKETAETHLAVRFVKKI